MAYVRMYLSTWYTSRAYRERFQPLKRGIGIP